MAEIFSNFTKIGIPEIIMYIIGAVLIYLAIKKIWSLPCSYLWDSVLFS